MKKLTLLLVLFSVAVFAAAPKKFTNDILQFGSDATSAVAELIFNVGDGATNPKITVDKTEKLLTMSTDLLVDGNSLQVGDALASDKDLTFNIGQGANNPKLFWDSAAGALSFTNDGTLIKKIGSGSGSGAGGVNFLANPSFEDPGTPILNWTASGGTFTQEDLTNSREDNAKFGRFVSLLSGEYIESDAITISDDITGCMARAKSSQGDNAFTLKVLKEDLPSNPGLFIEVAAQGFSDLTGFLNSPAVAFDCFGGDVFKLRIEATGAGTIDVDEAYLGSNLNLTSSGKRAAFVGSIQWVASASCLWESAAASPDSFQVDSDCAVNPRTVNGNVVDSSNGTQPRFSVPFLRKGQYVITYEGSFGDASIGANHTHNAQVRFQDGSNTYNSGIQSHFNTSPSGAAGAVPVLQFNVNVEQDMTNVDINLLGATSGGGADPFYIRLDNGLTGLKISLRYYPNDSETQESFSPEQAEFDVRGRIEGTFFSITSSAEPSLQNISNPNMIMINDGSTQAKIPCVGAVATGDTCSSSNELLGFVFSAPVAGLYDICFRTYHITQSNATQSATFWIEKRALDDSVALGTAPQTTARETTNEGWNNIEPVNLCGTFNITSVGEHRFQLKFTKSAGPQSIVMSNTPTRVMVNQFSARLRKNDVATPRLLNQISTRARLGSEKGVCHIINTGTPTFDSSDADCWFIQSVSNPLGTGRVQLDLVSAGFKCNVSSLTGNVNVDIGTIASGTVNTPTLPQQIDVQTRSNSSAALANVSFAISCSINK